MRNWTRRNVGALNIDQRPQHRIATVTVEGSDSEVNTLR